MSCRIGIDTQIQPHKTKVNTKMPKAPTKSYNNKLSKSNEFWVRLNFIGSIPCSFDIIHPWIIIVVITIMMFIDNKSVDWKTSNQNRVYFSAPCVCVSFATRAQRIFILTQNARDNYHRLWCDYHKIYVNATPIDKIINSFFAISLIRAAHLPHLPRDLNH